MITKYWNFWIPRLLGLFLVGNVFIYFNILTNQMFGIFLVGMGVGIFLREYQLKTHKNRKVKG